MSLIRKQRNVYALLFVVSICLAIWLGTIIILEAAFVLGAVSAISLLLLVRQSCLLYDATLIWDNRILAVPSAIISMSGRHMNEDRVEAVVSTFGVLIGSKIYRWGIHGVHGVRLHAAQIDKIWMYLTFGDASQTIRVELLHGMTRQHEVLEAAQKLLHETGVTASIIDW